MKKHSSMFITFLAIFILLTCFIPQGEGQTLLPLDKVFGESLCNEGYADYQHPLIHTIYYNLQNKEAGDYMPFCSNSVHFFFHAAISYLLEKRHAFSKWNQYIGLSQRPPPLFNDQLFI